MKQLCLAAALAIAFVATGIAPSFADTPTPAPAMSSTPGAPSAAPVMTPEATMAPTAPALPPMDFGSPPSGEIPILFNDHHVYANPDTLRQGRVLAALVKNGTLMVP
ncbi:MAG: hypothetical protein JO194_00695, partial [Candidatus Eremiobacteraeota bacterium]|nr:hypothetical protein [Candidatus Eremiobacteraeota bacterium]